MCAVLLYVMTESLSCRLAHGERVCVSTSLRDVVVEIMCKFSYYFSIYLLMKGKKTLNCDFFIPFKSDM